MELTTVWFILMPVLGRGEHGEVRRRVMLNTIGPVWDGNEVWVLTAGGATFAAFPNWYATMFSGFYLALLLILVALIVRALGFDYRGKTDNPTWRRRWDYAIFFGSALPALLWGVALTNVVMGLPINAQKEYTGNLFTLLNPIGLLGGLTTVALFLTHGAIFIALKTEGDIRHDAQTLSLKTGAVAAVLAVALLVSVNVSTGTAWSWIAAVVAAVALLAGLFAIWRQREGWAFIGTSVAIAAAVATLFLALFPDVMPSTTNAAFSLTTTNASSTELTLTIMTWVAVIFTPIVLVYTSWTYWTFRRRNV